MSKKYKVILISITSVLLFVSLIGVGYIIHNDKILKNSAEVIIKDNFSINYLNGKNLKFKNKIKEINFSVINDGDKDETFYINLLDFQTSSKNVTYELYCGKKKIMPKTKLLNNTTGSISKFLNVKALETQKYKLVVSNPDKESINFELDVEKQNIDDKNFASTIINNNQINRETKTKVGEEIAISNEGLILDVDDSGNTYYFRGNVDNNYVKFANKTWRIVRINGDKTVRLILDSDITGGQMYDANISDRIQNLKVLNNTKIYSILERWYNENLKDYDNFISSDRFCIDTSKENNDLSNYYRINVVNLPTFNCLGTKNNSKIGLITIDELIYAGATLNEPNNHFYIYSGNVASSSWTLSPFKDAIEGLYYYELGQNGSIVTSATGESSKSLRPVINIQKEVEVKGSGTSDDPYIID